MWERSSMLLLLLLLLASAIPHTANGGTDAATVIDSASVTELAEVGDAFAASGDYGAAVAAFKKAAVVAVEAALLPPAAQEPEPEPGPGTKASGMLAQAAVRTHEAAAIMHKLALAQAEAA